MKTAAIKMVSCAATYSTRKKASCVLEAIVIFVQVAQHVSMLTYTAKGRVGVPGREMPNGSGTGDKKKNLSNNSILSNAKSQEGKSTGSGQHNGKWDSCHWLIPSGGKKIS